MQADPHLETSVILLRRAQDGDATALEALAERFVPRLRRWAHGRLPQHSRGHIETEDLVQDAFVRTMARLGDVQSPRGESVFAYFRQAVMNRIRDELRRPVRMDPLTDQREMPDADLTSPTEQVVGLEALERFEKGMEQLSARDRDCIMARLELGLEYQDIAQLLGKPSADAARVAVGRALARLAKVMAAREPETT